MTNCDMIEATHSYQMRYPTPRLHPDEGLTGPRQWYRPPLKTWVFQAEGKGIQPHPKTFFFGLPSTLPWEQVVTSQQKIRPVEQYPQTGAGESFSGGDFPIVRGKSSEISKKWGKFSEKALFTHFRGTIAWDNPILVEKPHIQGVKITPREPERSQI